MNINKCISFKANNPKQDAVQEVKLSNPPSLASNPIQSSQPDGIAAQASLKDYNVRVPLKYNSLGTVELPCSTTAHMYKMENGQRVVIIPKEGATVVKTYVNVGSMNEPDEQRGISHFIEHNLFNGSEGLAPGEFFKTVNELGASTNASTGFAATDYYISSHLLKKKDLETKIRIHGSMIESPKFAVDMIEKEKGPVTSEINMILDDPENLAMNRTIRLLYGIDSTSQDLIGGTVQNINNLNRDKVLDYYQRNYYPANMVTVISGEVDPQETMKLVSKYFNSKAEPSKPRKMEEFKPITKSLRNDIISDKASSTIVCMAFNGPKNNNTKDKILLDAVQYFLIGSSISRLNKHLQEVQTNAIVNSDRVSNNPNDNRVIMFQTATSEETSEYVIKTIFDQISSLEKNPPTDQELEIVKKKLKLALAQMFESSEMINSGIGEAMLDNDVQSFTDFEKVIDNLSATDIVDFAKKYLDLNKVAISVVHPSTATEKEIKSNHKKASKLTFTGNSSEINHKEAIDMKNINKYQISNNINLVTNNIKSNMGMLDFDISVPAPADVKPGVENVLSIMLNRGSAYKDERTFFSDLEKQGIETYFSADRKGISATSTFIPTDSVSAIKSLKEVVLNPRFTEAELNYAKKTIKESLENNPKSAGEALSKEIFKGQFYGIDSQDVLANLDSITMADVVGLYKYILSNSQANAVLSGPFEKNPDLKQPILNELCKDFPTFNSTKYSLFEGYRPVSSKRVVVQEDNKSQAEIAMGYKYKISGNLEDNLKFYILSIILGGTPTSRLFSDLREQQKLAYRVNAQNANMDNNGLLSMYIKTTTDNLQTGEINYDNLKKSIEGFKFHSQKLMNEQVTDEELESAKLTLKTKLLDASEMTYDKNATILGGLRSYYGIEKNNKALELVDKITKEDIQQAAKYIFANQPVVSVVATKNTIDNNKEYLKSLGDVVTV